MEAAAADGVEASRRRRLGGSGGGGSAAAENGPRGPALSGQSYWLDVWVMLLIDLVLFVFVYLLP